MIASILITNRKLSDLNPLIAGEEICHPGHRFGPAVRRYTLIHYVVKGKGMFYSRDQAFPVRAGQAFLILPDETTTYEADKDDPWHYRWIGFDGRLSADFAGLPPVFSMSESLIPSAFHPPQDSPVLEYQLTGLLFQLYAELFSGGKNSHIRKVESYIQAAYMHNIRVEDIARLLNLDRRYLSRLFRENTGQSIQEYLISVRMKETSHCLRRGCSVQEAAALCGYEDLSCFSRMFKRYYAVSPGRWKNAL